MSEGWRGLPQAPLDGKHWPLDVAAEVLGIPERDLRDLVRITGLEPTGTLAMAGYRRPGRQPRAYDGDKLVALYDAVRRITEALAA